MAVKKNARVPRKRQHSRPVERIVKNELPVKKVKTRKALVIAQEIKFARLLANNDKRVRDKMLKNLKKWLTVRSESSFAFTEADFMRLWKGLFYCMWMSDKPLIQEELAESLSNIVHCFDSIDTALLYTRCTLKTLAIEWFGIDRYRLDKFQMLVRRIVRQTFELCSQKSWDITWVKGVASVIESILLDPKTSLGFSLHITELYMEELAKIGDGTILPDHVTELLRPFAVHLAAMEDERQIRHVMKHIFRHLIFQSDVGMDYMEKFEAWRQAGFPCANIDDMQKIEVSSDESEGENENEEEDNNDMESTGPKPLDPRAGRVDVELPQLPFDPLAIAELIKEYKFHPKSTAKTRRQIMRLIREFSELAKGNMPLGVKKVVLPYPKNDETNPKKAAYRLIEFDKELYSDTIHHKRKRKQPTAIVEDEEGFENVLEPINQEEFEENGFQDDEPSNEDEAMELEESSTFHISDKKGKKKAKKKPVEPAAINEISKKVAHKKLKKQKINEKQNNFDESTLINMKDGKQSISGKNIKIKSKKSKTKKFQSAINYLNQKLLNRSSDDGSPVKAKKSRSSNNTDWDITSTEDPQTPKVLPTSKAEKIKKIKKNIIKASSGSPSKSQLKKMTSLINASSSSPSNDQCNKVINIIKTSSGSPSKDQLNKIPWLHPVLTKLEDEKPKLQTPIKSQPEVHSSSSAKKRVKIMLRRNTAQHTSEYMRQLRQSPAIPYDANRRPLAGVLKPSPLSSPVNPFYKKV